MPGEEWLEEVDCDTLLRAVCASLSLDGPVPEECRGLGPEALGIEHRGTDAEGPVDPEVRRMMLSLLFSRCRRGSQPSQGLLVR